MNGTVFKAFSNFVEFFLSAGSCNSGVEGAYEVSAFVETFAPVGCDFFAVKNAFYGVGEIDGPVCTGRDDGSCGSSGCHVGVVTAVEETCCFSGGCGRGVIGVLADENSALVDKGLCDLTFFNGVGPGVCFKGDHGCGRANRTCAKIESGEAGDNFFEIECCNITDNCFVSGDGSVFDHFVEFKTCCNACEITCFIDGSEVVVIVGKAGSCCLCAGCVAELDFGMSSCCFSHVVAVAERGCKDDVAACFNKLFDSGCTTFVFTDVVFVDDLIFGNAKVFSHFPGAEVVVVSVSHIGRIAYVNETDFDVFSGKAFGFVAALFGCFGFAACCERKNHNKCKNKCKKFFHVFPPKNCFS